ncbi:MAG: sulfotransferase [Anaerolineales bacterium]|nr:sulfotransferase [Anaerolineales bacterium]
MIAQVDSNYFKTRPSAAFRRIATRIFFEGRPLTTKARWINSLYLLQFALEKKLPALKPVIKPIFIIGVGRSGTTILGTLLSMHPQVGFLNEPKAIWHTIYPEEDVIGHYDLGPARYRLDMEDASRIVKRNASRLFGDYLALTFSERLLDKNPELTFRVPFIQAIFPDAKFIFLVRNGWNTCNSIDKWSRSYAVRIKGETHDWWGVNDRKWQLLIEQVVKPDPLFREMLPAIAELQDNRDRAAVEWIVTIREGLAQFTQHPNSIMLLQYEQLLAQPRQKLTELLEFCELPADEKVFAYAEGSLRPSTKHHRFALHPILQPLFETTLAELGYTSV